MEQIKKWQDSVLANYLKKQGDNSLSKYQMDHIHDWMKSSDAAALLPRLQRVSVPQALAHSEKWVQQLNRKASDEEELDGVKVVHVFDNGYTIVQIFTQQSYAREGKIMGHCVATYYNKNTIEIFSLRDEKNQPHCTFELRTECDKKVIEQVKGKGNKEVSEKYRPYVLDFLKNADLAIDDINPNDLSAYVDGFILGRNIFDFNKQTDRVLELKGRIEWNKLMDESDVYPDVLKVSGDFIFENVVTKKSYALFSEIHISGNLYLENVENLQRLSLKVFVDGDVELTNCHCLLKLGDEVYIGGNASASDCPELKCFGNSGLINKTLMIVDCDTFQKKVTQKVTGKISIY